MPDQANTAQDKRPHDNFADIRLSADHLAKIGALDPDERRDLEARLAALPSSVRAEVAHLYDASVEIAAGSSFMIDEMSDAWDEPENAFRPVAIS